jgi:uncharacterized protein YidB (DUF937 family)
MAFSTPRLPSFDTIGASTPASSVQDFKAEEAMTGRIGGAADAFAAKAARVDGCGEPTGREHVAVGSTRSMIMSRGFPSMTALLGLLAVAGFQNRDKLAELIRNQTGGSPGGGAPQGATGGLLGGGLSELLEKFRQSGHGETADSWVSAGPNKELAPPHLETAIGPEVMTALQKQTGLSREEIVTRLSKDLPRAVDQLTPDGRLPS